MLTLSLMLQSAPLVRSSFTWSACLYSVAQIMGVQPPSSCGKLIMGLKISWRNTETTSIQLHIGIPIFKKKKTKTTTTKKKSTAFNFQSSWVQSSNKGKAASLRQSCPDATYSKFIHLNPRHMQQSAARHASIIPREPFKPSYKVLYSKNTHWKSILVCHMNGKQVNQWIFIFFNGSYRSYETYYSLLSFESNNF